MASPEFATAMKSVWDIARQAYTPVEMLFLKKHPEVVGKEDYFKPFEPLFKNGIEKVNWSHVEEKMQELLKPMFVFDVSTFSGDMKKQFSFAEHFFISVKNESSEELLGFATFLIMPEYAYGNIKATSLAVLPAVQNRGLGLLLMASIFRIISYVTRIFFCTRVTNKVILMNYPHWGFVREVDPVLEVYRYSFNPKHWVFIEYKADQTKILQEKAATLIER